MRLAIQLDDQPALVTGHVGEERADRVLAAELEARETPVAHLPPEDSLGRGHLAAEFACALSSIGVA
jgi:hypothetical protein